MLLSLLPLLVVVAPSTSAGDGPFLELEFNAALSQAKASEKVVFIDFFTTWCGPCKKLDEVTWKDAEVVAWLEEHTVPLKLDAEIEVELAKRYEVDRYPTMVFIAPDGELRTRLTGYKPPREFLKQAADGLAGIKPSDTARANLEQNSTDWKAHSDLADLLVAEGQFEEALELYLWCFDHGLEFNPGYYGVRLSFLLADLTRLGRSYPPTLEALRVRRDAAGERVLGGSLAHATVADFCALNGALGEQERSLELYEELVARSGPTDLSNNTDPRAVLFESAIKVLLEAERYRDIVEGFGDVHAWLEVKDRSIKQVAAIMEQQDPEDDTAAMLRGRIVEQAANLYQALACIEGQQASLEDLERALIEFQPRLHTWRALMYRARKAGRSDLQTRLRASALEQLPEEQHRSVPRVRG